ncbi:hypothetical protein L209DRAFT_758326 [Thermothelomyces heterothallicus CBS 203.75]
MARSFLFAGLHKAATTVRAATPPHYIIPLAGATVHLNEHQLRRTPYLSTFPEPELVNIPHADPAGSRSLSLYPSLSVCIGALGLFWKCLRRRPHSITKGIFSSSDVPVPGLGVLPGT